jgi:hypothetical protein
MRVPRSAPGRYDWKVPCRCDCGARRAVLLEKLLNGWSRSCGCLKRDKAKITGKANLLAWSSSPEGKAQAAALGRKSGRLSRTHGLSKHPLYGTWAQMVTRCTNPAYSRFADYGGRGIRVCDEWLDVTAFIAWIDANLGPRPAGMTLDRINNHGHYEPGNVRWATGIQQQANARKRRRR